MANSTGSPPLDNAPCLSKVRGFSALNSCSCTQRTRQVGTAGTQGHGAGITLRIVRGYDLGRSLAADSAVGYATGEAGGDMKVGFVGTGNMGNGMVRKLLRAGYETVVHDKRQEAAANLIELGATWGENPAAVAAQSEVIFTSLPGPAEVDEASLGEGGILEGAREGLVHTVAKGYGNL